MAEQLLICNSCDHVCSSAERDLSMPPSDCPKCYGGRLKPYVPPKDVAQVNARLDGCNHESILHLPAGAGHHGVGDFDVWECADCAQPFGPIFLETPRRP